MDTALIAKHCRRVETQLFHSFDKRKTLLLDVARELYPSAVPGLLRGVDDMTDGYRHDDDFKLHTTEPLECLKRGAAGFHGNLTSPTTPWFRLKLPDFMLEGGQMNHETRVLMDNVTQATRWTFSRSNAYPNLNKLYKQLLAFGFGCMMIVGDKSRIARCTTLRIGTYAMDVGSDGLVDRIVRRFAWNAYQIIRNFGRENCPQYILDAEKDLNAKFEICNLIEPNACGDERIHDKVAQELNMSNETVYRSLFWLKNGAGHKNEGFLRAIGYSIKPFIAPRMDCEEGDVYGISPGIESLDLCRGLQSLKYDELNIVGRMSEPAIIADKEMKDEGLKLWRGQVNYADMSTNANPVVPIFPQQPGPQSAREERVDSEQQIAKIFYNDAFSVIDSVRRSGTSGPLTATEVETQVREAMQRLAPVATLFDTELLDPLVSIMAKYTIAARTQPLTAEQQQILEQVEVEYVSAIHLAQKQSSVTAIQQVFQVAATMAQAGQSVAMHRVDADKMLTNLADLIGCPSSVLTSDEKVNESIRAEQEAATRQQQMQEAQIAAQSAKDLGGIPLDEQHAGSALAAALSQGGFQQ